tara:strand:- start:5628 stop:6500 length:873 start_codon:yes stop_codon:yes gene_type:complete
MALPTSITKEQFLIKITHIPTDESVKFYSWLTGFTDAFSSTWAGTPVYGRMDDLLTFTKTSRVITIAFDVVAKDADEARENQLRLNKLTQFLYPVYSEPHANFRRSSERNSRSEGQERYGRTSSQVLQAAPLLKMKFNSLVQNAPDGGELVGYLNGFTYAPDLGAGQFFSNKKGARDMVYQLHNVQLTFNVLHTHLTGWVKTTSDISDNGRPAKKYSFGSADSPTLEENYPRTGGKEGGLDSFIRGLPEGDLGDEDIDWNVGDGSPGSSVPGQERLAENSEANNNEMDGS